MIVPADPERTRSSQARAGRTGPARRPLLLAGLLASLALPAGCGMNMEQRAATGALGGLIVAGPVGAAVGAAVGAVVNEVEEDKTDP